MRLRIDPVACDAFGYCAELVPEQVWLDEWGYPVVEPGPVPGALLDAAAAAVRACPRRAITLQRTPPPDGPVPRSPAHRMERQPPRRA